MNKNKIEFQVIHKKKFNIQTQNQQQEVFITQKKETSTTLTTKKRKTTQKDDDSVTRTAETKKTTKKSYLKPNDDEKDFTKRRTTKGSYYQKAKDKDRYNHIDDDDRGHHIDNDRDNHNDDEDRDNHNDDEDRDNHNDDDDHDEDDTTPSNSQEYFKDETTTTRKHLQTLAIDIPKKQLIHMLSKLENIVHLDLKGAPPKMDYLEEFIPFIRKYGATGILIEYEDTFPYDGQLADVRHGYAYSEKDVKRILKLCDENNLKVIPLVQTYGHLEWLLKHKKFAHLREVPEYPQVITPCLNESYSVIFDILDQVIALHRHVDFFHIGCDEVYYKLEHPKCKTIYKKSIEYEFDDAYIRHVLRIASYVRKKLPKAKILIWDDMLQIMREKMEEYKDKFRKYEIEPMVWSYQSNVFDAFRSTLFEEYGSIFKNVWVASAFKGADGELKMVTDLNERYSNVISWINLMYEKTEMQVCNFRGIALTGWSRYDHFLALCELLPQAIPSLVISLRALQIGTIKNRDLEKISEKLHCDTNIPWYSDVAIIVGTECKFPGHRVYELALEIQHKLNSARKSLATAKNTITQFALAHDFIHTLRAQEILDDLEMWYISLQLAQTKLISFQEIYREDTIKEWVNVYIMPTVDELYKMVKAIKAIHKKTYWEARPLKLKKLKEYPELN